MMKTQRRDEKKDAKGKAKKPKRFSRVRGLVAGLMVAVSLSFAVPACTNSTQKSQTVLDGSTSDASGLDATVTGDASILDASVSNDASVLDPDGAVDGGIPCGAAVHDEEFNTEWVQKNTPYEVGGYTLFYKGVVDGQAVLDVNCASDNSAVLTDESFPLETEVTLPLNNGMQLTLTVETANDNFMVVSGSVSTVQ